MAFFLLIDPCCQRLFHNPAARAVDLCGEGIDLVGHACSGTWVVRTRGWGWQWDSFLR